MLNINRTSFCSQHWRRCWTLRCNVLWGTNKWLISDFPEDLDIKRLILATQTSSLFDSELRTPSLVYAIQNGLAFEVKLRLYLISILARRIVVSAATWSGAVSQVTFSSVSSQTKSNVNDLFFGQH